MIQFYIVNGSNNSPCIGSSCKTCPHNHSWLVVAENKTTCHPNSFFLDAFSACWFTDVTKCYKNQYLKKLYGAHCKCLFPYSRNKVYNTQITTFKNKYYRR